MRDKLKSKEYFKELLTTKKQLIQLNSEGLSLGKVHESKIDWTKYRNLGFLVESIIIKYSSDSSLEELKNDFKYPLNQILNSWSPMCTKINDDKGKLWDQYMVSPYERFLHLLSLAYLLEVSDSDFQILVDIIDRDNISDNLYEFIIKARFPDRKQNGPEEYDKEHSVILKVYDKLRKATEQSDKAEASKLVQQFLEKDFYHKHMNLYNSHKSKANIYCGYWSFEAAAVVKIMGLDDSSFIDNQYYPKDLVHQSPEPPKKKSILGKLGF
ncbi:PoNe immunity protein domain-containing protein [uncultured Aquimarina sp.]|uniref:PoNe immunity protein domain-containing protein n=1 Tax=uncultured Aquimarina sp. TaxID=575652 RepID=UPI00262B6C13|nr:PoNe immunity protein domain-containing protein [uncultured Aquimarina sp.]